MNKLLSPWTLRLAIKENTRDREKEAINRMGSFCAMANTILSGNERWNLDDVVNDWFVYTKLKRKENWEVYHELVFIKAKLFFEGCKKFKLLMPKEFIKLYRTIHQDSFLNLSLEDIDEVDDALSKHTGHRLKLLTEE